MFETVEGLTIRNGDRDDHFFRECEYLCAAAYNQLDLMLIENYGDVSTVDISRDEITDIIEIQPKVMIFKKNRCDDIPHMWRPLRTNRN